MTLLEMKPLLLFNILRFFLLMNATLHEANRLSAGVKNKQITICRVENVLRNQSRAAKATSTTAG